MENCLNCGEKLVGNYCYNCGQNAKVRRYTFLHLFDDIYKSIFEFDSNFFKTFKSLLVNPGKFIRLYLLGKRSDFLSPFRYLFIVLTLNIAVTWIIHKPAIDPAKTNLFGSGPVADQLGNLLINFVFLIMIIPFAAGMRIINKKYNLLENYVYMVYIHSQSILLVIFIQLVLFILNIMLPEYAEGLMWFSLLTLFYVWGFVTFHEDSTKRKITQCALSYFLGILIVVIPILALRLIFNFTR